MNENNESDTMQYTAATDERHTSGYAQAMDYGQRHQYAPHPLGSRAQRRAAQAEWRRSASGRYARALTGPVWKRPGRLYSAWREAFNEWLRLEVGTDLWRTPPPKPPAGMARPTSAVVSVYHMAVFTQIGKAYQNGGQSGE